MRQLVWMFGLCVAAVPAFAQEEATENAADSDVAAIRQAIDSYVDAFNKADATALAAHWTEQGEFITPDGKTLRGREQLAAEFTDILRRVQGGKTGTGRHRGATGRTECGRGNRPRTRDHCRGGTE